MTTTPNMGLVLPVDGGSNNVWNTILDTLFFQIDSHNHTVGQGVLVPTAGLGLNADLTFATNSAIHLKASVFDQVAVATVAGYANALFTNSADANLYFRNAGGVNVQITSGNQLNLSASGGIGGDYAAVSALVQYNDASRTYWLQQEGSPRPWAKLGTGDISIYEAAASIVNAITIKSPHALAAAYTMTLPGALPAAQALWTVDNLGNMAFVGNAAANPAPAIYASDFRPTVAQTLILPASTFIAPGGAQTAGGTSGGVVGWSGASHITVPIPLRAGDQITAYSLRVEKLSSNATTLSARIYSTQDFSTGAETALGAGISNNGNAPNWISLTETGLALTLAAGFEYYLVYSPTGGTTTDVVYSLEVSFVRP